MKRWGAYLLAGLLGGAAGYFLRPHLTSDLALNACHDALAVERAATDSLAVRLDTAEVRARKACEDRIDAMLAERPRH